MGKAKGSKVAVAPSIPEPSFARWFLGNIFAVIRRHGNFVAGCLTAGYCFYQGSLAVQAFAGRTSAASLQVGILANVSFVWSVSMTVSGLSIGLYLRERSLHRKTIERLAGRNTELEL